MNKASNGKSLFNETARVQMPALIHLTRLGYTYYGRIFEDMANKVYDPDTNILRDIFITQCKNLNPGHEGEAEQTLKTIKQELNNDDLGQSFYNRLISISPTKLIDFENLDNNTYHCTAELTYKNGQDEFRPDITLFVNGLPLVFIEVKRPKNQGYRRIWGHFSHPEKYLTRKCPVQRVRKKSVTIVTPKNPQTSSIFWQNYFKTVQAFRPKA